ncbi:MAG: DUF454 domain-containing protein [Marinilabiliales bacterium]|nr:MAG: DUF454 domain-containing protein [Marinilabiliales bacterium]
MTAGTTSLALGSLGIVVPLLPTTPFLLLTAACYIRSSDRLYRWLMNHRVYGKFLHNYIEHKAISRNVKIWSIAILWLTIITSAIFFISATWLRILFIVKAAVVTLHINSFRTLR